MGLDGFRCDAVPYLIEREGTICENLPETHAFLQRLRRMVDEEFPGKILLAEANQWPEDVVEYFGTPEDPEFHMAFHFPLMPRMFMAIRREDRIPIVEIMTRTPPIPENAQWAIFLRNHDELTLEMVTDEERDYMYSEYAKDSMMRRNVGIRRRLAPLLENSRRKIELMNSLLLSLPGTPVIYYGDEIGMGDNVFLGDRNGVRTPMQWSGDRNAGFSRADAARLYEPLITDPVYGFQAVNVEAQERLPTSLLEWMRRIIRVRKRYRAFGRGSLEFFNADNRTVLAYIRAYGDEVLLCVVNLSRFVQPSQLDLSAYDGWQPIELIGETPFPLIGELPYFLTFGPHSFYWFRLERPSPLPHELTQRFRGRRSGRRSVVAGRGVRRGAAGLAGDASLVCRQGARHQRDGNRGRARRARRIGLACPGGGAGGVHRWGHRSLFLAAGADRDSWRRAHHHRAASGAVSGVDRRRHREAVVRRLAARPVRRSDRTAARGLGLCRPPWSRRRDRGRTQQPDHGRARGAEQFVVALRRRPDRQALPAAATGPES